MKTKLSPRSLPFLMLLPFFAPASARNWQHHSTNPKKDKLPTTSRKVAVSAFERSIITTFLRKKHTEDVGASFSFYMEITLRMNRPAFTVLQHHLVKIRNLSKQILLGGKTITCSLLDHKTSTIDKNSRAKTYKNDQSSPVLCSAWIDQQ